MSSFTLEPRDITIAMMVSSFIEKLYPDHEVVSIEYDSDGIPDEGFCPMVTICPKLMGNRPDEFVRILLRAWITHGQEFVTHENVVYDLKKGPGAYKVEPSEQIRSFLLYEDDELIAAAQADEVEWHAALPSLPI